MVPEKRLLILTCELNPTDEIKEEAKKIVLAGIDSKYFLKLAIKHKTFPIVLENFSDLFPGKEKEMRMTDISVKKKLDNLLEELIHISKVFEKNKIPFIILKGFPLAQALYGNYYLRTTSDIDLLIKKRDLTKAESLLFNEGYEFYNCMGFTKEWYVKNHMHFEYSNKAKKICAELHWTIRTRDLDENEIPEQDYWKDLQKVKVSGHEFNVLNPEFILLFSCFHYLAHCDPLTLNHIHDIHLLVNKYKLKWDSVVKLSRKYNCGTCMYHILLHTKKVFGTDIPDNVIQDLKVRGNQDRIFINPNNVISQDLQL
jgi:hypothetical protein